MKGKNIIIVKPYQSPCGVLLPTRQGPSFALGLAYGKAQRQGGQKIETYAGCRILKKAHSENDMRRTAENPLRCNRFLQ